MKLPGHRTDLTGKRFGSLVVQGPAAASEHGDARWACRCDCGQGTVVRGYRLRQRKDEGGIRHCKACGAREGAVRRWARVARAAARAERALSAPPAPGAPAVAAEPVCRICGQPPVRPVNDLVEPDGRGGWRKIPDKPACFVCWSREDDLREAEEHGVTWFGAPEPEEDSPQAVHDLSTGLSTELGDAIPEQRRAVAV